MPESRTNAFHAFVRKDPFPVSAWPDVLESRRALLREMLKSSTLPALGNVVRLRSENGQHELRDDRFSLSSAEQKLLATQGIFGRQPQGASTVFSTLFEDLPWDTFLVEAQKYAREHPSIGPLTNIITGGKIVYWGLLRSGSWGIATITYDCVPGYDFRARDRAAEVELEECSVRTMIIRTRTHPLGIWRRLGDELRETVTRRAEQLESLRALEKIVDAE